MVKKLKPIEIAHNVDRYMSSFRGKTKFISKLALTGIELYPLIFLRPPNQLYAGRGPQSIFNAAFLPERSLKLAPPFIRMLVQAAITHG
jgi:hypothetical protein